MYEVVFGITWFLRLFSFYIDLSQRCFCSLGIKTFALTFWSSQIIPHITHINKFVFCDLFDQNVIYYPVLSSCHLGLHVLVYIFFFIKSIGHFQFVILAQGTSWSVFIIYCDFFNLTILLFVWISVLPLESRDSQKICLLFLIFLIWWSIHNNNRCFGNMTRQINF